MTPALTSPSSWRHALSLGTLTLIWLGSSGCREPQAPSPSASLCGEAPFEVFYGSGRPFEPLEEGSLLIEYGLQGGYHVDVSLRFVGELDPDLVHVNMRMIIEEGENPEGVEGTHSTQDWYLLFPDEGEELGCYFHRARIFLFDAGGEIPTESMVAGLDGATAELTISLDTDGPTYSDVRSFPLRFIPPSP